jgi:hypothetical protein
MTSQNVFFREIMALHITRKETESSWVDRKVNLGYPYIERKAVTEEIKNTKWKYNSTGPGFKSWLFT